jgi:glycosyltransferase involved in cell wall biosynthesis
MTDQPSDTFTHLPSSFDTRAFWRLAPEPLTCRRAGQTLYAVIQVPSAAPTPEDRLTAIIDALRRYTPLPVHITVIGADESVLSGIEAANDIDIAVIHSREAAAALLMAEAVLFMDTPDPKGMAAACLAAAPVVIDHAGDAEWPGAGIGMQEETPERIAGMLLVVATDPPVRRRTLDGQREWLEASGIDQPAGQWSVQGVFDSSYSLAIVNRQLAGALAARGQTVSLYTYEQGPSPVPDWQSLESPEAIRPMWERSASPQPPAVALRNAFPPTVSDMRGQRRVLANYAWEETTFPAEYAAAFNRVLDLITVVSSQTARMLQDAGVHVPIAVVGNGVDHLETIQTEPTPVTLPAGFRFLHISSCFPRKGVDTLLDAYGEAFRASDDVTLVIKTFPNPHNVVQAQLEARRAADPDYPAVEILEADWTPGQIASLYSQCHALVAPSRGDGFGLPMAEAMRHEIPVIVTGWGGQMDFCSDQTAWLIDYELAHAQTHLEQPDSLWAEPDRESLCECLRTLYVATEAEKAERTQAALATIRSRYTWDQVATRTIDALAAVDQQPAPLPTPRIAWISTWGSRCGIADYSQHLITAFGAGQLQVFAPTDEYPEYEDPAFVHRNWQRGGDTIDTLLEAVIAGAYDAVVLQHNWSFMNLEQVGELVATLENRGVCVFVELHNTRNAPEGGAYDPFWQQLGRATRILGHSIHDMRRLSRCTPAANLMLFPLAIYPLPAPNDPPALRAKLGLEGKRVIATFGFLMEHKGLAQVVEALPDILALRPDTHLLMLNAWYGPSQSEPAYDEVRETIKRLGLETHVTLITDFLSSAAIAEHLALTETVIFAYQNTDESASAAVRMALSARRPIAVTPLPIFDDLRDVATVMAGTTPAEIALGVLDQLTELDDADHRASIMNRVRAHAEHHDARSMSGRLRGAITGCVRQLTGSVHDRGGHG